MKPDRNNPRRAKPEIYLDLKRRARHMRHEPTDAENLLWQALRNRRLCGRKFRRQHPILTFIVDFYCPAAALVVEVDGGMHTQQREHDRLRQACLERAGLRVLRVTNDEVLHNLEGTLDRIAAALEEHV